MQSYLQETTLKSRTVPFLYHAPFFLSSPCRQKNDCNPSLVKNKERGEWSHCLGWRGYLVGSGFGGSSHRGSHGIGAGCGGRFDGCTSSDMTAVVWWYCRGSSSIDSLYLAFILHSTCLGDYSRRVPPSQQPSPNHG